MEIPYHINLNDNRRSMLKLIFPPVCARLRSHDPFDILEAIFFIVYTGCHWNRLPIGYPPYKTVYHHYRSWSARGYPGRALRTLVLMKRHRSGLPLFPTLTLIDSQSVRTGLPHAVSGVDGGKRVKGIIKSNYGPSGFVPIGGRWVVERTFSWLQAYRRLMRNYERCLCTAGYMTLLAMIFFMLRYFA